MAADPLSTRITKTLAKFGRTRNYGMPRHLNDYMLKDIGITSDDLGTTRKR